MFCETNSLRKITLVEANNFYNLVYPESSNYKKIRLKCWMYECSSSEKTKREVRPFYEFTTFTSDVEIIKMLRGYLIDCSEFGGIERAVSIIVQGEKRKWI